MFNTAILWQMQGEINAAELLHRDNTNYNVCCSQWDHPSAPGMQTAATTI